MPMTDVIPEVSADARDGEVAAQCAACPHPRTAHDRIATRYCAATIVGKTSRGCVCSAYPDDAAPITTDKDN